MNEIKSVTFEDRVIVACGTLFPELNHMKENGFLNAKKLLYTKPGRHEVPKELEECLIEKINIAKKYSSKIIVVYGGKYCYTNIKDVSRTIDKIIYEQGAEITRINASHCIDMLADEQTREKIAGEIANGDKVWWLSPGWVTYRHDVFQDWDRALANENFPRHTGGAILLDAIDFWEDYCEKNPEKILDFSDWMGIDIKPYKIPLDRFKELLLEAIKD